MDVACEKCRTEYEFDESLISESGTTVKCTNCGHLFRMYKPGTPESKRHSSWMLRQPDGSVYTFERMTTLQRWIAEGKASRWDMISRTGDSWKALGEVAELAPFFEKADVVLASRDDEEWPDDGPTLQKPAPQKRVRPRADPTIKGFGPTMAAPGPIPDLKQKPTMPLPMVAAPPRAAPPQPPSPSQLSKPQPRLSPVPHVAPSVQAAAPPVPPAPQSPPAAPVARAAPPPPRPEPPPPQAAAPPSAVPTASAAPQIAVAPQQVLPGAPTLGGVQFPPSEPDTPPAPAERSSDEWAEGALLEDRSPAWAGSGMEDTQAEPEPDWADDSLIDEIDGFSEEDLSVYTGRRSRKFVAPLVIMGLLVLVGVGIWFFKPELVQNLVGEIFTSGSEEARPEAYLQGREYFLLDTPDGFAQADRAFHRSASSDGLSQAGLAEVYTTWAQQYLDDVADSQLRATKADAAKTPVYAARAELQEEAFSRKLEQARRFIEGALKNAPDIPETHRAAADYYRLTGDLAKAHEHIEQALTASKTKSDALPETEYVKALVDLAKNGDESAAIQQLQSVVESNGKLVRCQYRLARLLAATGEKTRARSSVDRVLALSKEHEGGILLRQALSKSLLVAIATKTISPVGAEEQPDAGAPDAPPPPDGGTALAQADTEPEPDPEADPDPDPDTAPERDVASASDGSSGEGESQSFDALVRRATEAQNRGSRDACGLFRRADRVRGGNAEVLVGLGYCALDEGRSGAALGLFRRAGSNYGPALIGLAEASQRSGSLRQAAQYYRRYLERHPSGGQSAMARRNAERIERQLGESETPDPPDPATPPSREEPSSPPPTVITPDGPAARPGTPDNPTTIRVTEDHTPPTPRSDSLATESEPPLRPGENLD